MRYISVFASPAQEPSKLEAWARKRLGLRSAYPRTWNFGRVSLSGGFAFMFRTSIYDENLCVSLAFGWPRIYISLPARWFPAAFKNPRHQGLSLVFMPEGFAIEIDDAYFAHRYFWSPFYDLGRYLALDETWKPIDPKRYDNDDYAWFEHPYTYVLPGGGVQEVTATVRRTCSRSRWHWFGGAPGSKAEKVSEWLRRRMPFGTLEHHYIDVTFSDEVGPSRGSYKGGVIQTSFKMRDDEYAEKALYRMMRDKIFR